MTFCNTKRVLTNKKVITLVKYNHKLQFYKLNRKLYITT